MLRLPPDGYRSRLSDYLNAPEREFLSLTDVEIEAVGGDGTVERYPFMALSLRHVVVAMPADEGSESGGADRPRTGGSPLGIRGKV